MLQLISNNKAGRNLNGIAEKDVHWKELFKTSEDSLTSCVFGLLLYLPVELFWTIIRGSCYSKELPDNCGRIISYEFWPRWNNESETHTEPDIFIEFENFDLIIEAKRFDDNQQYKFQWEAQLDAYYRKQLGVEDFSKKVYLLAVGGITRGDELATTILSCESSKETVVIKSRWRQILKQILFVQKKLIRTKNIINTVDAVIIILDDLILSFRIHGFLTSDLFETLTTSVHLNTNSLNFFTNQMQLRHKFYWQEIPASCLNINKQNITLLANIK